MVARPNSGANNDGAVAWCKQQADVTALKVEKNGREAITVDGLPEDGFVCHVVEPNIGFTCSTVIIGSEFKKPGWRMLLRARWSAMMYEAWKHVAGRIPAA